MIASSGRTRPIGVVIVDDHALVREGIRRILDAEVDFECIGQASTPDELLALLERERPDLVLLDLRLGRSSGVNLVPRLAAQPSPTPTLIVTAFPDEDVIADAIRFGAKGVVLKDAAPDTLLTAMRAVVAGQVWIAPEVTGQLVAALARGAAADAGHRLTLLTAREREIMTLVGRGLKNREIAEDLGITVKTAKGHLTSIFGKLGVADRLALALLAVRMRLVEPPGEA